MSEIIWREWGDAAFADARRLDRPILLDIGAVWCHWCHVMDHGIAGDFVHTGTYSNPEVIDRVNRNFIPIKVDNDRRPDINARYNMGGWPTTAFLTPDGDPLYGATYLTPPQMTGLLDNIASYYQQNKLEIIEKLAQHNASQIPVSPSPRENALSAEIGEYVASEIERSFDSVFGGFGIQPKFPHPEAINFALERYAESGDSSMKLIAAKTLTEMAAGGMYDQFAGGFFRYSTTRDWSIPHYEKMLEDNSRLLSTNLLAFQVLGDDRYREVALDVKRFFLTVLLDPATGTLAGSQDADREEEYYGRPLSERELMPTPYIDSTVYVDWNALAISAFVDLYRVLDDEESLSIAERLYNFLTTVVAPLHYYVDGKNAGPQSLLSDTLALTRAALDLFEVSGKKRYLAEARGLADTALLELFDDEAKLFRDVPVATIQLGALSKPKFDQEDNSHFAEQLIRIATITGSSRYQAVATTALQSLSSSYRELSYFSSAYARAVASLLTDSVHIVVVGERDDPGMKSLLAAANGIFLKNKVVEIRSPEESGDFPPDADNQAIAYVCIGTHCSRPLSSALELLELLKSAN